MKCTLEPADNTEKIISVYRHHPFYCRLYCMQR